MINTGQYRMVSIWLTSIVYVYKRGFGLGYLSPRGDIKNNGGGTVALITVDPNGGKPPLNPPPSKPRFLL